MNPNGGKEKRMDDMNMAEKIEQLARENERQRIRIEQLLQRIAELETLLAEKS